MYARIEAARRLRRQVFVREGLFVAFPLCCPGVTTPIPRNESRVTALAPGPDGSLYGGTSGRRAHLFAASFRGATGLVLDLGAIDCCSRTAAICVTGSELAVAAVNGADGGRLAVRACQYIPPDMIQEWGLPLDPIELLPPICRGEPILDLVPLCGGGRLVGATPRHLFVFDPHGRRVETRIPTAVRGRLITLADTVYGADDEGRLWRFEPSGSRPEAAHGLPDGDWGNGIAQWAPLADGTAACVADGRGAIFRFRGDRGFDEELCRLPVPQPGPMAACPDGRVFGFCGDGVGRFFCVGPQSREAADLGAAVSVLERRRYGYRFGSAAMGACGELYFGEDDDAGHLWIYFPSVRPCGGIGTRV